MTIKEISAAVKSDLTDNFYQSILYYTDLQVVEDLIATFKSADIPIDNLQPAFREYHQAVLSGNFRWVIQDTILGWDIERDYGIIYLELDSISEEELEKIIDKTQGRYKVLIINTPDKNNKEGFLLKHFYVNIIHKRIIAWRYS